MPEPMPDAWLEFAQTITTKVGAQLLADFGQAQADVKSDGSLVTASDRWADATLRQAVEARFPDHGVLSEEGEHGFPATDWCWIIDPIDGTTNFTRGIPVWGISLGLLYRGTPVFGYVAFPPLEQVFHGSWPGASGLVDLPVGAYCNGRAITVSPAEPDGTQFFSLCARSTQVLQRPFPCKIRMLGSAAYNLLTVGAGWTLGAVEATPKIWDIAGVWPILQAAGATWTALDDHSPFPLAVGTSYGQHPYPTLVTARADWMPTVRPLVQGVVRGPAGAR